MWRMEEVLELYEEPYDPKRPVVCFDDELPHQLLVAETRTPFLPTKPCPIRRATTTSTSAEVRSTSSRSSNPSGDGDTWTSPIDARRWISPWLCAAAGGRALPRRPEGAGGSRQPQHPQHRSGALPGFRARGGEAHLAPVGVVPLHAQARLLARPGGGDRVVGAFAAVLGASYPRRRDACEGGDRGMGTGAQRRRGDGAVALHGVGSSGEAGMPLPGTIIVVEY